MTDLKKLDIVMENFFSRAAVIYERNKDMGFCANPQDDKDLLKICAAIVAWEDLQSIVITTNIEPKVGE